MLPAMPKKKQYLRYEQGAVFGVVCSRQTGALLIECSRGYDKKKRRVVAAAPALESVILWDLKRGEKVKVLRYHCGVNKMCSFSL